jgi:CubicO group peptidase (beta-lactamase class C family)
MRRRILIAGIAVLATVVLRTAAPSAQQPSPLFSQGGSIPVLDSYLEALRQQAGIPGLAALILKDGETVWEKGYGFANTATRERVSPDTPFLVGDMSGTLAAVLLLQCVEQRRIELDQPLSRYSLSSPEPEATLRGLLSHAGPGARGNGGDSFVYSPERYSGLTALMEWCAPQPYRKSVSHRLLNRLAMRDSVPGTDLINADLPLPEGLFEEDELARYRSVLQRLAVPYKVTGRTKADRMEMPIATMSATGGLVSTVRDLAKLDNALSSESRILLLDETLAQAWNPAFDRAGQATPMGLGWFVQFYRNERVVWHFGQVPNAYSSLILKIPGKGITFILLANSDGLSNPFQMQAGDVTRSPFATLFLKLTT